MTLNINVSGATEDSLNLVYLMDGVLERIGKVFQDHNVSLPKRQYWTFGTPVVDCEQIVVAFNQLVLGTPGDTVSTPSRYHVPRTATMTISIARQVPVVGQNGRPPSPEQIERAAHVSAVDSWILMESTNLLDQWDQGGYGLGVIATLDANDSEGGYQIISMQITMAVP
jgi:hypothetical protein